MLHPDSRLRSAGSETLGRLCSVAGTSFMSSQVQFCVAQVVGNTDPHGRAGCALAFGEIYSHVGGLSAGPTLKTIVDVLMSLGADPHPLVHYWAMKSLARVIDAASLSYGPFINATIGAVVKLYNMDSHEQEGGSPASVNLRPDLPAYQAFCQVIDALIGVLGPELLDQDTARALVLILLKSFQYEREGIAVEAVKATQHLLIFAPNVIEPTELVQSLRSNLSSSRQPLKTAAINSVYQLVQRDASLMSRIGGDKLVSELFALLDDDPSVDGVRDTITSWLKQTVTSNPSGWIDLCQRIMSRTTAAKQAADAADAGSFSFMDEESQGLGVEADAAKSTRTTSRWRTQLFALQCLHQISSTLAESGQRKHFDAGTAKASGSNTRSLLIGRVADLIRMAFTASTAPVMEIRLEGLVVLRDVIKVSLLRL